MFQWQKQTHQVAVSKPNFAQYSFGHLDFCHLILFRISDFEIRIFMFYRAMPPAPLWGVASKPCPLGVDPLLYYDQENEYFLIKWVLWQWTTGLSLRKYPLLFYSDINHLLLFDMGSPTTISWAILFSWMILTQFTWGRWAGQNGDVGAADKVAPTSRIST